MVSKMDFDAIDRETLREVCTSLDTAVAYYNRKGQMAWANRRAVELIPAFDRRLSKFTELIHFVYDHSLDMEEQRELVNILKAGQSEGAFSDVIQLGDNIFYLVRTCEMKNPYQGTIVEFLNISAIKRYTDELRTLGGSNKILIETIQASQKGIFIAENGPDGRILFANRVLDHLLNRSGVGLEKYNLYAFLESQFPDDREKIIDILETKQKGSFWRHVAKSGENPRWLRFNLSAESQCDGRDLVIGFISDDTQSKMQESHLLQTQKLEAIGKLAGGIAHDFNNILSIVDGFIRLSESALKRGEDISGNFTRIKQAVSRGSGLTRQLLMFGKHKVADNKVVDLCAQVKDMKELLQPLLGVDVHLVIETPDTPCPVKVAIDNISQIVMNLVLNARDAMPEGGQIIISVLKENDDFSILKVTDTGTGIPHEIMDKIFDPFFTTKEQGKGTGLGLSMVYGLVTQAGGKIDIHSVIGEGTSFLIHIPLVEEAVDKEKSRKAGGDEESIAGKTILLAEDEPDLLEIMKVTLEEFDMNVMTAQNGNEALRIQDEYEGEIDFLLTDMVMPELGGLHLAELVKQVRPEINVLFMSGYPVRGEIAKVDLPEEAIFMAKPVKPEFLRTVLEQVSQGQSVSKENATTWQT